MANEKVHKKDFPFGIEWVADRCGLLSGKVEVRGAEINVQCPTPDCKDTKMHFAINTVQDTWVCPRCGKGGGMLDLYLLMNYGSSYKDAARDLYRAWKGEEVIPAKKRKNMKYTADAETVAASVEAPIENRSLLYNYIISQLSIDPIDLHNDKYDLSDPNCRETKGLLDRGFTLEQIIACGYKTMRSSVGGKKVNMRVPDELVLSSKDVSGFFTYAGKRWANTYDEGLLVPCRDLFGNIGAMQLRGRSKDRRFGYFTSGPSKFGRTECTKAISTVHHVGIDPDNVPKKIYFTEGPMKADLAHFLSADKKPFIAIPGVSNRRGLLEALTLLKERGCETIAMTFDNDQWDPEKPVMKCLVKVAEIVREAGLKITLTEFDMNMNGIDIKGVDDYLWARKIERDGFDETISLINENHHAALKHFEETA